MRDELVPISTHLFRQVHEIGGRHFEVSKQAGFKGRWVSDNVAPEMFVLFIASQLAPFKHSYVERVGANLRPKCRTGLNANNGHSSLSTQP